MTATSPSDPQVPAKPRIPSGFGWLASLAISFPMVLIIGLLLLGGPDGLRQASPQRLGAMLATWGLLGVLFFLMVKTGKTNRYRSFLFIAIAVSFVMTFIPNLLEERGNIALTQNDFIEGKTPFCHIVIPMVLIPAAFTKTIIFPGSMIAGFASIGSMLVLWLGATLCLGRGWCSWVCFFGGMDEGCSKMAAKRPARKIDRRWLTLPVAILLVVVLASAATLSPTYCEWLCPFKAVTEFEAVTSFKLLVQTVLFIGLFISLVIVLPILTGKRTQCALFCPMGAFQGYTNAFNLHELRIDREVCSDCGKCTKECPTLSITPESVEKGRALTSCTKCGSCIDACPRQAIQFHIKGTSFKASPRLARILFLYPAYMFLSAVGGGMMVGAILRILRLATTGSML